jgi:ADP-heptose:LPS heptosyltransferase
MIPPAPITPLVIRFGAFGDMVLLIPMLKALAARYGRPCDIVSSGAWTEPLLARVPVAGRRFYLTSRRAPYWFNRSQRQLVAWLRQRPPGPIYIYEPDEKPHRLVARAGIRPEWICSLRDLPRSSQENIQAHALRLARETPTALCATHVATVDPTFAPDARPTLTDEDRRDCTAWLAKHQLADAPLVLLQPGNKKTMKGGNRRRATNVDYWPELNWADVITGIRETLPGACVLICGSPAERSLAEEIVSHLPRPEGVLIATNDLPIPRLLAVLERAHSMISVNTGPAHAAAAMGCPLAVMFSRHPHRGAALYAPQPTSGPVTIVLPEDPAPDAGLATISPAAVLSSWRKLHRTS